MDQDRAVSKSVSLPASLWNQIEEYAPTTPGGDRSGYIRNLVSEDLQKNGPESKICVAKEQIMAIADDIGFEAALQALQRAARKRAA
jgi:metal-responsive CopG/Arc/MetJ family transcriptional regulator